MAKTVPVYALVGDDSFVQLEKLRQLLATLPDDAQRVDVDGETAELGAVIDELRAYAMFGGEKVVVVRSGDEFISRNREGLERYLQSPSSTGLLVLRLNSLNKAQKVPKLIQKIGTIEDCNAPPLKALPGWIASRAKAAHKTAIAPDAANLLAERIGSDLARLDMEISRLALLSESGQIDRTTVEQNIVFQREQEMWDLTNELAMGSSRKAMHCWRKLLEVDKSAEFRAITWLTIWLEDVGQALKGNTGKMGWKYRERLGQFIKTAQNLGPERHRRAVALLARMDRRSKSGLGEMSQNVERFILQLAL